MPRKGLSAGRVRIVGGAWRGRKLAVASGIRPTPDRARETLFNWLAGRIAGARVLDLFAGTGALGLEALSRGASSATFVEQDRVAASALARQCQTLGARAAVRRTEALQWLDRVDAWEAWDVVFLDPPFGAGLLEAALDRLHGRLAKDGLVYVEAEARFDFSALARPRRLRVARTSRAGDVAYGLLHRDTA